MVTVKTLKAAFPVILAVAILLPACDRGRARPPVGDAKKITVTSSPWPASASLYIAREKGYFRDEGLDAALHFYLSGHLGLGAVLSGEADFAALGDTPIARAAVDGERIAIVATISEVDRAIQVIARKDKGVLKPDDLVGRKIGRVAGSAAEFFLHNYLVTSRIDLKRVRAIDVAPDDIVRVLLEGDVDAVATWAPHTTTLLDRLGDKGIVLEEPGLYTLTWNIIAAKDLTQRDPDVIARFLRAIVRANRFIDERPAEARAITAKICGMDIGALEKDWCRYKPTAKLDQALLLNLEDQARWMIGKKAGGEGKIPDFLDFLYTKGLKGIEPEKVRIVCE
jgi:ABC-type nitrate/sulfonate/bicarbonate transport system substrate-binding protein